MVVVGGGRCGLGGNVGALGHQICIYFLGFAFFLFLALQPRRWPLCYRPLLRFGWSLATVGRVATKGQTATGLASRARSRLPLPSRARRCAISHSVRSALAPKLASAVHAFACSGSATAEAVPPFPPSTSSSCSARTSRRAQSGRRAQSFDGPWRSTCRGEARRGASRLAARASQPSVTAYGSILYASR